MTSKRSFLNGMKEDLRHKIWMLALSLLGSFLAMPVMWLLKYSNVDLATATAAVNNMTVAQQAEAVSRSVNLMTDFFREELLLASGVIAIVGAVIVGLESFHYLQQKSMVDTYHSLPVSRTQLFGIKYINGLLIWLVPYLLCAILTLAFSGILLARMGVAEGTLHLIPEAAKNAAALVIAFLLVYHLLMLATMLTGNMINTLAVAVILGAGAISAYVLTLGFMSTFFQTYYGQASGLALATYSSPLAAPIVLLGSRGGSDFMVADGLLPIMLACLGVALMLLALAWLAYLKRPSERAGRGLTLRWIAGPLRLLVSIMGGMGGWLFMYYLVGDIISRTAWCVFGALLAGMLAYGVLDVVFSMDFKAFFRHRWGMGAAIAAALLICLSFQEDWLGYDRYLPEQGQIREASIFCSSYTNVNQHYPAFKDVRLTDAAQIHAFLERGIENVHGCSSQSESMQVEQAYRGDDFATDAFYVRVVLNNGRSYYRKLEYYEWDEDVVLPLLVSEEYARGIYYISEETIADCNMMRIFSGIGENQEAVEVTDRQLLRELAQAYNQDLTEQPRTVILGEGKMLGQLFMTVGVRSADQWKLDILEGMSHTLEVMERNGIKICSPPFDAGEVESITFTVDGLSRYWYTGDFSISPVERSIRGYFGVYPETLPSMRHPSSGPWPEQRQEPVSYSFTVTDPMEIAELLPLIQYSNMKHIVGVFVEDFVKGVSILDSNGKEWSVRLRMGALPEKYIQRFIEEAGSS